MTWEWEPRRAEHTQPEQGGPTLPSGLPTQLVAKPCPRVQEPCPTSQGSLPSHVQFASLSTQCQWDDALSMPVSAVTPQLPGSWLVHLTAHLPARRCEHQAALRVVGAGVYCTKAPPLKPIPPQSLFHPNLHDEPGNRFHADRAPSVVGGGGAGSEGEDREGLRGPYSFKALKCRCVSLDETPWEAKHRGRLGVGRRSHSVGCTWIWHGRSGPRPWPAPLDSGPGLLASGPSSCSECSGTKAMFLRGRSKDHQ